MESESEDKTTETARMAGAEQGDAGDTDAYYGEDDMDMEDLDLSFLDEEDEE